MCNTNQQGLNEMTENETNQRTITEQMNRKESETVGETRPGEERSEVKVTPSEAKGTCTVAMMAGMATEGSGCVPRRHDDLTPHTRHTAWTHSATVWTDHVLRRFRLMYLHTIPDTCAQASPWLGLEHAYHNGQCRQNDQWWPADYRLVGGYSTSTSIEEY